MKVRRLLVLTAMALVMANTSCQNKNGNPTAEQQEQTEPTTPNMENTSKVYFTSEISPEALINIYKALGVEAEVGMCGPPDADDRDAECRGEVHVGGIHADHEGEVAYDVEFFGEGVFTGEGGDRGGELGSEGFELRGFVFAAKEEYTVAGRGEHGGELAGVFPRPYLGLVLGKGSEADGVFGVRRSAFGVRRGGRTEAEAAEYIGIAFVLRAARFVSPVQEHEQP